MYRKPFFHTSLISPFNSYEGFLVASVLSILFAFIGFSFIIVLCLVPKVACFPVLSIINCPLFFSLWFSLTSITMCEEHTDVRLLWFFALSSFSVLFPRLPVSLHCPLLISPFFLPLVFSNLYQKELINLWSF